MSSLPRVRICGLRLLAPVAGALSVFAGCLAIVSASAYGHVEVVAGTKVGLQPREIARYWEGTVKANGLGKFEGESNASADSFNNNPNHAGHPGPVMHSVATYAVYWDPQDYYHGDWQEQIDGFLAKLGSASGQLGSVFAVDEQYTDTTNKPAAGGSAFRGAYTDTNPYPETENCTDPHPWTFGVPLLMSDVPVCLTDKQIRAQLKTFISEQHGLPTGMGTIYYLFTPPGVTVCLDAGTSTGHCSDFDGTIAEISGYEEAKNKYPEELLKYETEREEGFPKYEGEKKKYEEDKKLYEAKLEVYNKNKTEAEAKNEPFNEAEPVKPVAPVAPVKPTPPSAPAGYSSYKQSFCSYHSDIDPSGESGGPETILYATVPWIAGGAGDGHLIGEDQVQGYDCQDGGFEPGTKSGGELQEKEHEKIHTAKEEEEFDNKSAKEKREQEEAEKLGLEKPHEQEPNQLGPERGPDGTFDHGLADMIINQIAVEQQDTITDPLLNGWQDPTGNEVTDECRNSFYGTTGGSASAKPDTLAGTLYNQTYEGGDYYLNDAFNLAALRLPYPAIPCLNNITLQPHFTAPNPVNSGEIVGFDGMESNITLDTAYGFTATGATKANYPTYTWNFGDGSPEVSGYAPGAPSANSPADSPCAEPWLTPCAASTFHTYQYGGTYEVTLTVKDVGGNVASITEPITVDGPSPPSPSPTPEPSPTPGAGSNSSTPSTSSGSGSGSFSPAQTAKPALPAPLAAQAVSATSIGKATRKGLIVRYQVNEQVTGSFNVLLAASLAERIGLHMPLAHGLPAGTLPQEIVGRALLITTRGGRGTIKIKFSRRTGARLRRLHRVSLMLQLDLRNATGGTTTVLSKIALR